MSGSQEEDLFQRIVTKTGKWMSNCSSMRWFTDGERRYGKWFWLLASVWLKRQSLPAGYDYRKVWREGLEMAIKIKGSQGRARRQWVKIEHLWIAINLETDIHANHCEAQNVALRRRCSAF